MEVASASVQAEVLPELGARVHRLRVFRQDLLRTPIHVSAYEAEPFFWGSFVMAPWCNRIDARRVMASGRLIQVPANVADGSAIHGQVYRLPWELQVDGSLRVEHGGHGWPWRYEASLLVTPGEGWLRMQHTLTNRSDEPMPGGLGMHPWFRRPIRVAIRGDSVFSPNSDTPAVPAAVDGSLDLRELRDMPPGLDATWTDLDMPLVELEWPDLRIAATMRAEPRPMFVVAASPPDIGAIAVEPQTHAPQGLRRLLRGEPGGLTLIQPGGSMSLGVELAFRTLG